MPIVIRSAQRADIGAMTGKPLPHRVRAYAVEKDGELLGVGGLGFQPDGTVSAFVIMRPGASRHKMALHKAALATLREARRLNIKRITALAEDNNPAAVPWLLRLGFRPRVVSGQIVFIWQDT